MERERGGRGGEREIEREKGGERKGERWREKDWIKVKIINRSQ